MQPTIDELDELQFRSVLITALHTMANYAQRSFVNLAVLDIEEYLNTIQDDTSFSLLAEIKSHLDDEGLLNYYATR